LNFSSMDQEALKKLANQLRKASSSGGPKGFFAGGGLIVALIAGGVAVNASLFNGP
jgi:prohibitin 2